MHTSTIWEIARAFYSANNTFQQLYGKRQTDQPATAAEIRGLTALLKKLEKASEPLHSDEHQYPEAQRDIFYQAVAVLRHETRDLREMVHQVKEHQPVLQEHLRRNHLQTSGSELLTELLAYSENAQSSIPDTYDRLQRLFDKTTAFLEQRVMPTYASDMRVLKTMVLDATGETPHEKLPLLFRYMYGDEFAPYYKAADSWLSHSQDEPAAAALEKMMDAYEEDPSLQERCISALGPLQAKITARLGMVAKQIERLGHHGSDGAKIQISKLQQNYDRLESVNKRISQYTT